MIYMKTTEEAPEPLMYFVLFGSSLLFTRSLLRVIQVTNMVLMVLAVRRLLLAVMVFCFELGFLMSMNAQVVHYLRRSSAVRRLNAKWLAARYVKLSCGSVLSLLVLLRFLPSSARTRGSWGGFLLKHVASLVISVIS